MPAEQKEIYFLLGTNRESAEASPYFKEFREKKFEVLFLLDPRDEFVMDRWTTCATSTRSGSSPRRKPT